MPTLTVYTAPIGTTETNPSNGEQSAAIVGHMYYTLTDQNGNRSSYGFYPATQNSFSGVIGSAPGTVKNDDADVYATPAGNAKTIAITQDQYNTLSDFGMHPQNYGFDNTYQAITYSCVDFVWAALGTVGVQEPAHFPGTLVLPQWNTGAIGRALDALQSSQADQQIAQVGGVAQAGNTYDPATGLLASSTETDANGNVIARATFTYSADGTAVTTRLVDGAGNPIATSQQTFTIEDSRAYFQGTQTNYQNGSAVGTQALTGSVIGQEDLTIAGANVGPSQSILFDAGNLTFAANSSGTVFGSSNNAIISAGATASVYGSSGVLVVNAGGNLTVTGTSDTVTLNGSGIEVTVHGNQDTVTAAAGSTVILEDTVDPTASYSRLAYDPTVIDTVTGSGITVTSLGNVAASLTGTGDFLTTAAGDSFNVLNNGTNADTIELNGASDYLGLLGGSYAVGGSNATILTTSGTNVTVVGDADYLQTDVNGGGGSSGSIIGTGDTVIEGGANDSFGILNNKSGTDTVNEDGAGDLAGTENVGGGALDVGLYGAGDVVGLQGGAGYVVTGDEGFIDTWDNTGFSVNGSYDNIETDLAPNGAAVSGSGGFITGTGDTLTENGTGDDFSVTNNGTSTDTANLYGTADVVSAAGGTDVVNGDIAGNAAYLGAETSATVSGSGGYVDIYGSGTTVSASGDRVDVAGNAGVSLIGSGDAVTLQSGDVLNSTGGFNIISAGANTELNIAGTNGAADAIYVNNDASGGTDANGSLTGVYLGAGAQANLVGSDNTVGLQTGDSLGANGGGNVIDTGANDLVYLTDTGSNLDSVYGSNDAFGGATATGQSTGVILDNYAQANLAGSNDGVTLDGNNYLGVTSGTHDSVSGSGDTIYTIAGTEVDLTGGHDTIDLAVTGGSASVDLGAGSGYTVGGSGDAISLSAPDEVVTVSGDGDAVTSVQGGETVGFNGTGERATLNGSTVYANGANEVVTIAGNNDVGSSSMAGDTFGFTGTSDTAVLNHGTVDLNDPNEVITVVGSNDTAGSSQGGETVGFSGTADTADLNGSTIYSNLPNQVVTIVGNNDVASSIQGGETFGFTGSADTADLNGGTVDLNIPNESATVNGNNDVVGSIQGNETLNLYGKDNSAFLSGSTVNLDSNNVSYGITGNNDKVDGGTSDYIHIYGSSDTAAGGSKDSVYVTGTQDKDTDSYSPEYTFGTNTGDVATGTGDSSPTSETGGDGYDFGNYDDGEGDPDFVVGATKTQIAAAPGVAIKGPAAATDQFVQSLSPIRDGVASAEVSAGFSDQASSPFEGTAWNKTEVTWSLSTAADKGTGDLAFSNVLGAQDQSVLQSAMADWEQVSGLHLVEDESGSATDIKVGWGNFDTANSAILGYTAYNTDQNGAFGQVQIRMEDASLTPLTEGSDGMLTYSGTNAELYQVALHEIGHALGLADNADPNSVMYYGSGPNNRSLDATDITEIQSLYGAPSPSVAQFDPSQALPATGALDPTSLIVPSTVNNQQTLAHAA